MKYERIENTEDLMIVGISDASFKTDDKPVGGVFLFRANSAMNRASPIYWKAKQIERVCHSSKGAETLNFLKIGEASVFSANQLELLLYGDVCGRIPVCLFIDSESTLESVASSMEIITKTLQMTIVDLKERLLKGDITKYSWLLTEGMWADLLTKERTLSEDLEDVLIRNNMNLQDTSINEVKAFRQEVRMTIIQNCKAIEIDDGE